MAIVLPPIKPGKDALESSFPDPGSAVRPASILADVPMEPPPTLAGLLAGYKTFVSLSDGTSAIVFDVSPKISETGTVTYTPRNIPHLPTSLNYFESVSARTFSVSDIKFISRTDYEAEQNKRARHLIKSWSKNSFGVNNADGFKLGMPPKILLFRAYCSDITSGIGGINDIPVVITQFDFDWPNDVDYIADKGGNPTPIIQTCSLGLLEMHSPQQITQFDFEAFKNGTLLNW